MAKAGDGTPRSQTRKLDTMISLRVSTADKRRFADVATRLGYDRFASYHLDCLRRGAGLCGRKERMIVGHLGGIAGDVQSLARTLDDASRPDASQDLREINQRIADLQREIMIEGSDAGQEDP